MLMTSDMIHGGGTGLQSGTRSAGFPSPCAVQLWYATLPRLLRPIAVHYWFAVLETFSQRWQRWEVWQAENAGGKSLGYVHCDRRHPACGVGGGPSRLAVAWDGSAAQSICAVLAKAQEYPHWNRYRAWPGPNSNTFVAWVLRQAGLHYGLDPRAIGKDYMGLYGVRGCSRPLSAELATPLLSVKVSLCDGVEVHLLGFTCGLGWWPLKVSTPFGRLDLGGKRALSTAIS
jgi:Protein of unknown function (DUF3750)